MKKKNSKSTKYKHIDRSSHRKEYDGQNKVSFARRSSGGDLSGSTVTKKNKHRFTDFLIIVGFLGIIGFLIDIINFIIVVCMR